MHKILSKQRLNSLITRMEIEAFYVVRNARPGQFVIIHIDDTAERIPLTICDVDKVKNAITVIFQKVGTSTMRLDNLQVGEQIKDLLGPLGHPTPIRRYGNVLCVGGGVGVAEIYPVVKALKDSGNRVVTIVGSRSKELLILKDELEDYSDEFLISTDDGSLGHKGFVTGLLEMVLKKERADIIFCVGPLVMMKRCAQIAVQFDVPIRVSLASNMVDATGMCGTCRVRVGGESFFTCVDGPEFDGALVDFDGLMARDARFRRMERISYQRYLQKQGCRCESRIPDRE